MPTVASIAVRIDTFYFYLTFVYLFFCFYDKPLLPSDKITTQLFKTVLIDTYQHSYNLYWAKYAEFIELKY